MQKNISTILQLKKLINNIISKLDQDNFSDELQSNELIEQLNININYLINISYELDNDGSFDEVDNIYDFLIEKFEDCEPFVFERAENLANSNPTKSFELYSWLINRNPRSLLPYYMLIKVSANNKEIFNKSKEILDKACKKLINSYDLKYCYSIFLTYDGEYQKGLKIMQLVKENFKQLLNKDISLNSIDYIIQKCRTHIKATDDFINEFIEFSEMLKYISRRNWPEQIEGIDYCEICDGNSIDGCNWSDPTECPRY